MQRLRSLASVILTGMAALTPVLSAQEQADTLDLRQIFDAADSVDGRPIVDTLPELISCPQFDARNVRGDETTSSIERRPVIESRMGPVRFTMEFVVGANGRIERRTPQIVTTTDDRLDRSFEYWVMGCRFRPGKIGDHAVRVRMQREWSIRPIP